ncbi:MAG: hypothetical protein AMJ81_07940 [Phycisphaerae bacterium SM23_33]|nr:MAG: hypothetical protein AMJ81_07940 [Phycisphaerae bacterium SM23_33]
MENESLPRHRRPTGLRTFLFGAPYYPEHWSDAERADDAARMAAAGVNCVRMAEFAWDRMEPVEGEYDFSFFDEQVECLGGVGIRTILCTPTATPPRWLSFRYPEVLRVDAGGRRMEHGSRQHCCTNSPAFREQSWKITSAMAEHFAYSRHVIGWQTDNELNCHFSLCYCEACQRAFREWCRRRYDDDIGALNEAWGTAFWAQSYGSFDHIVLPYDRPARANPGHVLDHRRFVSDSTCEFQREQVEILRRAKAEWLITHNGLMPHIDYAVFARDLDFLGVDLYPAFTEEVHSIPYAADRARSAAGNVLVPELQAGPGGQVGYIHRTPPPGQMRLWAYQAVAHGADGILHFRWRTCRFGAEEYWCGVLDHDNKPRRRYQEFSREGNELRRIGTEILGTSVDVAAAVLAEYDQEQAHAAMPLGMPSPSEQARTAHHYLWRRKLPVGIVEASDSFDGLKLIVLPSFTLMDEALAWRLTGFVRAGGTLLMTAWTGTRDRFNRITDLTPPGLLAGLAGVTVEEYGRLDEAENAIELADGTSAQAHKWYEVLAASSAELLGRWRHGHYAWALAVTLNRLGAGRAIYVGTYLSEANAAALLDLALAEAGVEPILPGLPADVEAARRTSADKTLLFLLNHGDDPQTISRLPAGRDLITGKKISGQLVLDPKDVAIIA